VAWTFLVQNRDHWQAFVKTTLNLRILYSQEELYSMEYVDWHFKINPVKLWICNKASERKLSSDLFYIVLSANSKLTTAAYFPFLQRLKWVCRKNFAYYHKHARWVQTAFHLTASAWSAIRLIALIRNALLQRECYATAKHTHFKGACLMKQTFLTK
jgi:hypothetical protein